ASRKFCSWREREELFRTDAAVFEFIDGNAIAGVTRLCAESVGEGGHGSVEAVSIKAERQAEGIGLVSVVTDGVLGEGGELIGVWIQHCQRLLFPRGVRAVTTVEKYGEFVVRRQDRGGGEIVDRARMAGNLGEGAAVG